MEVLKASIAVPFESPEDHLLKELLQPPRLDGGVELGSRAGMTRLTEPASQLRVLNNMCDSLAKSVRIALGNNQTGFSVANRFRNATVIRANDGQPGCHGFQRDGREPL